MRWYRRIKQALELLAAVERLQDKLRAEGTPCEAIVGFDRERLTFFVTFNRKRVEGWPLCRIFQQL